MLVDGLPPEAATWREEKRDEWTLRDEIAAVAVERHDAWSRALFDALIGRRPIDVPGQISIPRPGDQEPVSQRPEMETNPNRIAAFFGLA